MPRCLHDTVKSEVLNFQAAPGKILTSLSVTQFWPDTNAAKLQISMRSRNIRLYNHSTHNFSLHIAKSQKNWFISSLLETKEGFSTCTDVTVVPLFKYALLMQLMVMMNKPDKTPLGSPVKPTVSSRKDSPLHLLNSKTSKPFAFLPALNNIEV